MGANQPAGEGFGAANSNAHEETSEIAIPQTQEEIEAVVRGAKATFGDTLPKDFLSAEEYALYERLYGPPLRATEPFDLELMGENLGEEEELIEEKPKNVLLRETADGEFEEVDFDPETSLDQDEAEALEDKTEHDHTRVRVKSQREADAIKQLQQDMAVALAQAKEQAEAEAAQEQEQEEAEEEEEVEEEEMYEEDDFEEYQSSDSIRTHPNTMAGRWGTSPSTIYLPHEQLVQPITELLSRVNNKHLYEAAERAFGGQGLPFSPSTPTSRRLLPQKHIGLEAGQNRMSEVEADAYMAAVLPGTYASVYSTLVEVRKRLGSSWLRGLLTQQGGPRVLDAGAGGAGAIAWREILQAEWETMVDEGLVEGEYAPSGKTTVLTGPTTLRHRMSQMLENTSFLPRLPDYLHSNFEAMLDGGPSQPRKVYDIVIAPHTLFPLKEDFRRKNHVQNLWSMLNPDGGVLLLIEKGVPRGFEAIAGARDLLLKRHISSPEDVPLSLELQAPNKEPVEKEKGMIIAPCTNHTKCPMYLIPGETHGRKDFCHFNQRYIRPPFLQRILGAKGKNHEDLKFSYLAVRRGVDSRETDGVFQGREATEQAFSGYEPAELEDELPESEDTEAPPNPLNLPRTMSTPLKRTGHVTMDLCTPDGKLERWTIPRSFSKQAYRDARKAQWGDLWALGAKTRVERPVRLGKDKNGRDMFDKSGKRKKGGTDVFAVDIGEHGMEGVKELMGKKVRQGKRTKGGRVNQRPRTISDDDM
jgi:ribosomal protein RSM22 (predicted rRNA methylase)